MSETINKTSQYEDIFLLCLQMVPFVFYIYFVQVQLDNIVAADSFRYLWEGEHSSTLFYFLNSSLSVRTIYTLAQNDSVLICQIQLAIFAAVQLCFYSYLKTENRWHNIFVAVSLSLLFASFHSKWLVNFLMSDSLFTTFNLLFVLAICFVSKISKPWQKFGVLFIAIFFILSKNPAPYVAASVAILVYTARLFFDRLPIAILIVVVATSLVSIKMISQFDTTTELNAAQNIMLNVLPDKTRTKVFTELYDMPRGPYLETCSNGNVNLLCLKYQSAQNGSNFTRSYKVITDDFGFSDWIREKGMKSWQHYILFQEPWETINLFIKGYNKKFDALFAKTPSQFWDENYDTFLDKYDSFVALGKIYQFFHLNTIYSLLSVICISGLLYFRSGYKKEFLLIIVMLADGLAIVFIGFFGDISSHRHVYPGILSIYIGQLLFIYYAAKVLGTRLSSLAKP